LRTGAPGEIRTPDLQLRSVNRGDYNTVTRLAFLQLSESPFGGILSILLLSCAHLTYSANTQWVITGSKADERRFPRIPRLQPACLDQHFMFGVSSSFRDGNRLFGTLSVQWRCNEKCTFFGVEIGPFSARAFDEGKESQQHRCNQPPEGSLCDRQVGRQDAA